MPTYEYYCTKCGHEFEAFHSMSANPVVHCPIPDCGGPVKRKIGAGAGLIFKGSGFYITDYKMKSNSSSSGGSKKENNGASSKSDSTST